MILHIRKTCTFIFALLLLTFIPIATVNGHSVLEKATPEDGEKSEASIDHIELFFNTKVEIGSTLHLVNRRGEKIEPNSITITDNVLEASFSENLSPGTYQVNWEILGADGHIIEDQYSFTIEEQEKNAQSKSGEDNESNLVADSAEELAVAQADNDTEKQNSAANIEKKNKSPFLIEGIISLLVVAGIVLLAWIWRNKTKRG